MMSENTPSYTASLVAGGTAGLAVDVVLYPLDTIKTRLQSGKGFLKAGGFRGVYSGLGSITVGSMPSAAFFFCSYDAIKRLLHTNEMTDKAAASVHIVAASVGEISACIVRVPVEIVKQRTQVTPHKSSLQIFRNTFHHGGVRGFYRGYFSTLVRDIPFSIIQFPIWEYLKSLWSRKRGKYIESWQSAICGAVAGGIAAAVTTPLDVAKTRIMLSNQSDLALGKISFALVQVFKENGIKGLFAGLTPRVLAISFGGAIFLGVYEKSAQLFKS